MCDFEGWRMEGRRVRFGDRGVFVVIKVCFSVLVWS